VVSVEEVGMVGEKKEENREVRRRKEERKEEKIEAGESKVE
jgi:hypothetical protein